MLKQINNNNKKKTQQDSTSILHKKLRLSFICITELIGDRTKVRANSGQHRIHQIFMTIFLDATVSSFSNHRYYFKSSKTWLFSLHLIAIMVHTCNLNTGEVEAGGPEGQG